MKKKIVYFLPDNPISDKAGNTTRCFQLLSYFEKNHENLDVDFVSFLPWEAESEDLFNKTFPHIQLRLIPKKGPKKTNYLKYLWVDKLPKVLRTLFQSKNFINQVTPFIEKKLKHHIAHQKYDISLISYASWGRLNFQVNSTYSIIDTHDFITKQFIDKQKKNVQKKIGALFQQEINILKDFDEIWSYSMEEHYIFEQFLKNQVKLMPVSFPVHQLNAAREIDIQVLYVASDNPHNIKSMEWFISEVLPHIPGIRISVIGKICNHVPDHEFINKLGIVDELDSYYQKAKLTICPMLSGTGIKIKVLESLSYGLPVVTSRRGVDGLINKTNNGCLVSNDPLEFGSMIKTLLTNPELYVKTSQQAEIFFKENYSSDRELTLLNTIFLEK